MSQDDASSDGDSWKEESYDDTDRDSDYQPNSSDGHGEGSFSEGGAASDDEGGASDGDATNIRELKTKKTGCAGLGKVIADLKKNGPKTKKQLKPKQPKGQTRPKPKKAPINIDELPPDKIPYNYFSPYCQTWTEEPPDVYEWVPKTKPPVGFPEGGGTPFDATCLKTVNILQMMLGPAIDLWRKETYKYAIKSEKKKNFRRITRREAYVWIAILYSMGLSNKKCYDVWLIMTHNIIIIIIDI